MFLLIITIAVFILSYIAAKILDDYCTYWADTLKSIGTVVWGISLVVLFFELIFLAVTNIGVTGSISRWETQRSSLIYQLENDLYDDDNDLGKKELYSEIQEWNEKLMVGKAMKDNPWIGIYYPDRLYESFEPIKLEED